MKKSSASDPEAMLKNIRKLPENKMCPNCGTSSEFGFGNVCVKFNVFVCDLCKTSHQAISHRVKSLTMSTWTLEEVRQLEDENGGGNAACRHVWLGNAPPYGGRYPGGTRPKPGDRVEIFKQFVIDCYENGKFKATTPYQPGRSHATGGISPAAAVQRTTSASSPSMSNSPSLNIAGTQPLHGSTSRPTHPSNPSSPAPLRTTSAPPAPPVPVEADLLGFGFNEFDSMTISAPLAPTPTPATSTTHSHTSSGFNDDIFGTSTSTSSIDATDAFSLQIPSNNNNNNAFGGFDEFNTPPNGSPVSGFAATGFDPFAAPSPGSFGQPATPASTPVDIFGTSSQVLVPQQLPQQPTQTRGLLSGNSSPSPLLAMTMNTQSTTTAAKSGLGVMNSNVNTSFAISSISVFDGPMQSQPRPMGGNMTMGGMGANNGRSPGGNMGMGGMGGGMGGMGNGGGMGGGMGNGGGMSGMGGGMGMGAMGGSMGGAMNSGYSNSISGLNCNTMSGAYSSANMRGGANAGSSGGRPSGGDSFSFVSSAMQQHLGGSGNNQQQQRR